MKTAPTHAIRLTAFFVATGLFFGTGSRAETASNTAGETGAPAPAAAPAAAKAEPVVVMQAFQVSEAPPKLDFGMSLNVWTNSITKKVTSIYVTKVKPGSDAERAGIGYYTQILSIDGKPVEDMEPSFKFGTDLNHAFVNRKFGDKLTLTVVLAGSLAPIEVHLINKAKGYTRIDYLMGR